MTFQNQSVAPSCPISLSENPPGQAGLLYPAVPKAMDLPSVLRAVNTITQILQLITGQLPPSSGGTGKMNTGGGGGAGKKKPPQKQTSNWEETNRVTEIVKVVNPDDEDQFVTFKQIKSITMENQNTGEQITLKMAN